MLKIRLQRIGRKHDPSYRIVATKSQTGPKSNKHVAILGQHDSIRKTTLITDGDAIKDYIAKGAQVSPRVHNILVSEGVIEGKKVNVLPKKTTPVKEVEEEEAK
jgi:small subunit ribosomal protein S16